MYSFPLSPLAPCPPDNVQVWLMSQLLRRQVLRFSWTQVPCSDVQYLLTMTGSLYGDNEMLFDLSSSWTTSTAYEMPLPCGSSFVGSVGSRTSGGNSAQLRTISGTTGTLRTRKVQFWEIASVVAYIYICDVT